MFSMNSKTTVSVFPRPGEFPARGGVREHMRQLLLHLGAHPRVKLEFDEDCADIVHVESAFKSNHRRPDVYVCHGGFVPRPPLQVVLDNLKRARVIVSVAHWIARDYFPHYAYKTIVIPNGVVLEEWQNLPSSGIKPGYVLYAKEIPYHMDDFIWLVNNMPDQHFVSLVWPEGMPVPSNVTVVGLQSRESIRPIINDAVCLMLTGSEVCPTMLLEAWACKVPVIAKTGSGSEELMYDPEKRIIAGGALYGTGGMYSTEHLENLPNVVSYYHENKVGYATPGYDLVVERYQWKDLFERYVRLYEALIYDELGAYLSTQGERPKAKNS